MALEEVGEYTDDGDGELFARSLLFPGYIGVEYLCMHGSPCSPYDSKDIWKKYDYRALGIENEPYLDTNFSQVFYFTDTGHRMDGYKVSVRDKIPEYQDHWVSQELVFHSIYLEKHILVSFLLVTNPSFCINVVL